MIDFPKTLNEAQSKRYGQWSGCPNGQPYNPNRCAYGMFANYIETQCSRKPVTGLDNLYCTQHAKKMK